MAEPKTYFSTRFMPFVCITLIFYPVISCIYGQSFHFDKITTREGLSQNTINCIFQDHRGFLWLGTQDGLCRYDGYDFKVYRHHPEDSTSLTHSWIWDITEDDQQNLWVATWDGLNQLPANSNSFIRYYPDSITSGYRGRRSTSFSMDPQGNLWIGTWGGGINRYQRHTNRFINYQAVENVSGTLPSNLIRDILHDRAGRFWVGTWDGLSRIDSISETRIIKITTYRNNPEDLSSLSDDRITCLYEDKKGDIWIGTLEGGLNRFDPDENRFYRYKSKPGDQMSLSGNDISSIVEDQAGKLWVGTFANGLNRFNEKRDEIETVLYDPKDPGSLAGNYVYSIFEDQSGLIWVGANALNKYNPFRERFHHVRHDPEDPFSLSHQDVGSIFESADGDIWIGTEGGGLNRYLRWNDRCEKYAFKNRKGIQMENIAIGSLAEDKAGRLWVGTRRNGIYLFDKEAHIFKEYAPAELTGKVEEWQYVNYLISDKMGYLWIATFNNGLFRLDPDSITIRQYMNDPGDPFSLPGNYLLRLYLDDYSRLWIASWGGGLSLYDEKNDGFLCYLHDPEDSTTVADNIVYTVNCSKINGRSVLWVGTGNGLSFADLNAWPDLSFSTMTVDNGLPNNTIYSIQSDSHGNLWISTNYGLSKYNTGLNSFHNYYVEDGLQANEFNGGAGLTTSDGFMIFGGINGFNFFHPDSILISHFSPEIVITSIFVQNEIFLEDREVQRPGEIKLNHKQDFFSFEFSALDFIQPQKIRYAYMLEGVDREWVYVQNRRLANYTAIEPGNYVFKVKSTNSDQIWLDNEKSIEVSVIPPLWQTWWFRVLGFVSLLVLIYGIHRYRIRKILELERLRVRIASDLHDDFGSALTRIAIHSEQIQHVAQREKIQQLSRKIGDISRDVISSMSDIVWSIDARNDTLKNLVDRIQEVNVNILSVSNIDFNFTQHGMMKNKSIPVDFRQNIYYIYKEAINNVVKHSQASCVDILLENSDHRFFMKIKDNGRGFDQTVKFPGNGLKNMQMRAERIKGLLQVRTGKGTEILFTMKKL